MFTGMLEFKFLRKLKKEPYSEYKSIKTLNDIDIHKMYSIYKKYYSNTDLKIFKNDLLAKTGVFVIRDSTTNQLVGFSTVMEKDFIVDGKVAHGFFSGDTIIEEAYWGSRALQRAMFRYVIKFKLRHTTKPIYWILISKGFKTYLLLANNYYSYYPHPEHDNSNLESYVKAYCEQLFPEYYNSNTGLLDFGENYQALNSDVAPITDEMRAKSNKIAFFEKRNPTWVKGTELPCIGRVDWIDLYRSAQSFFKKKASQGRVTKKITKPVLVKEESVKDDSKVA